MMTASGRIRPPPALVTAAPRVLWVGPAGEPWLAVTRALRLAGGESHLVSTLDAASSEVPRLKPSLVLVHWRLVSEARGPALSALRTRSGHAPVALVVEADTPAEVLEAGESEGVEDCLLLPLRFSELRARLAVLTGEPRAAAPVRPVERFSPRVVLMAGASGPRAWGGLGALLEACGHHLVYSASVEGAAVRLADGAVVPHLVLVSGEGPLAALRLLSTLRSRAVLEGVPALTVAVGPGTRAPGLAALLPRIDALLGRDSGSLHVEERVPFCCPVEFGEGGSRESEWTSGFSVALSPGGLIVRTLVPLRPGTAVKLRIHLPTTRERLDTPGVVAWANPFAPRGGLSFPYGMGVRFLGMGPPRLMHLRQLCQPVASL
ncbi:PilZ domain-containing protein [Pyxidicoccus parkwayensis]|uniref:PilZ domain-containing protein n=1 Tax=Pyxidicoccus parkwayensis TaxID=2813578 RepID=A0ABX7NXK6_9BACT|nr:PilZ domain-containing protein [Pyxidicoccus parkwaysis]QSQ22195.1 PilZ domain-containing protein [Pyxidicoccus parkwaysis]